MYNKQVCIKEIVFIKAECGAEGNFLVQPFSKRLYKGCKKVVKRLIIIFVNINICYNIIKMNLLLINDRVKAYNTFFENVKSDTIPLVYPFAENTVLPDNIERIGIVFYGSPIIDSFIKEHLERLVKKYNITTVDFLGCNTLKYPTWINYYNTLINNTGVRIGASDNNTGNLKYGGDWIMETTAQDIKAVYFTEGIENYSTLLDNDEFGFNQTNNYAFAALKNDGSVVTWGYADYGGNSSAVDTSNVKRIFLTAAAFAALKNDGSVVTWGYASWGGDSSAVLANLTSGVKRIFSTGTAFAALKNDGSVVTWGNADYGGNSSAVATNLNSNVKRIFSTNYAFAALKNDGSVVTWGNVTSGGNSSAVATNLTSGVKRIFSHDDTFAALKNDGSVVTWGYAGWGYPIPAATVLLLTNVKYIAGAYSSEYITEATTFLNDELEYIQEIEIATDVEVTFNITGNTTYQGYISGTGKIIKTGTGVLTLTGDITFQSLTEAGNTYTFPIGQPIPYLSISYYFPVGKAITNIIPTITSTVTGGSYTYTSNTTLPDGLNLNSATGIISGTPTTAITQTTYTITQTFSNIVLLSSTITITIGTNTISYPAGPYNFQKGKQIQPIVATKTINVSGPTYSIKATPALPEGLSVDPSTGTITGRPIAAVANKVYTIILTDGNSVEWAITTIILDVKAAPVVVVKEQLQYNGGVVTCTVLKKIKEKI